MTAAKQMLEVAKEDLDLPAIVIHQRNDFGWNVEHVGHDSKEAIAVLTCGATSVSTFGFVRLRFDHNQTNRMIGPDVGILAAEYNHLVRQHTRISIGVRRVLMFEDGHKRG